MTFSNARVARRDLKNGVYFTQNAGPIFGANLIEHVKSENTVRT